MSIPLVMETRDGCCRFDACPAAKRRALGRKMHLPIVGTQSRHSRRNGNTMIHHPRVPAEAREHRAGAAGVAAALA
jgi:hypothetical protein